MKRKRRRPKDHEKWNLTEWMKACDSLWGLIVKLLAVRDACGDRGSWCAVCSTLPVAQRVNASQWHAHHIITKDRKFFRHDLDNGMCLCACHHMGDKRLSAHKAHHGYEAWMEVNEPQKYELWITRRNETHKNPTLDDYRRIHAELTEKMSELGGFDAGDNG